MTTRTYTTDFRSDCRKLFNRPTLAEFFKSPEFRYLKKYIAYFTFIVKEDSILPVLLTG
jgi:hypothetical protein